MKKRTHSSQRWLKEHFADPYVKLAQQKGYRSRAVFKLEEIDKRDQLLKPGMVVVDLGAAPGGWSQLAKAKVGGKGRVIAMDILPMPALPGVEFIQGDFTEDSVLQELTACIDNTRVDLVISDMAPNMSGMRVVDQPRAMYLAELALDFALRILKPEGSLLIKVFQGVGFVEFRQQLRQHFKQVLIRKPEASRGRSHEVYLLARERI
jgi:23S rRNA (uridine2552-2'-O)-methyltransferase